MTLETILEYTRDGTLTAYQEDNLIIFFDTRYLPIMEFPKIPLKISEMEDLLRRNAFPVLSISAVSKIKDKK